MSTLEKIKARVEGHTEGPWRVDGMDAGHSRYEMNWWVTAGEGDTICDMDGLTRSHNEQVALNDGKADAELIAAAPKLLAALEAVEAQVAARQTLWDAICAETCVKGFHGVDHRALADAIAASITATIAEALA